MKHRGHSKILDSGDPWSKGGPVAANNTSHNSHSPKDVPDSSVHPTLPTDFEDEEIILVLRQKRRDQTMNIVKILSSVHVSCLPILV